jgi:hypothetical protein
MNLDCLRIPTAFRELDYSSNPELADKLISEVEFYCESAKPFIGKYKTLLESCNQHLPIPLRYCANAYLTAQRLLYYQAQDWDKQVIVTLPTILQNFKYGCRTVADCKTYALLTYCLLKSVGMNPKIVFASYRSKAVKNHVFVTCDGYIVDATISQFNTTPKAKFFHVWQKD